MLWELVVPVIIHQIKTVKEATSFFFVSYDTLPCSSFKVISIIVVGIASLLNSNYVNSSLIVL